MVHIPVMLKESLKIFEDQKLLNFFDGTLGAGRFAQALLKAHPEIEVYFGCDRDESALRLAKNNLREFEGKIEFIHANFYSLEEILREKKVNKIDGFFLT